MDWAPSGPADRWNMSRGPATNATTELDTVASPAAGAAGTSKLLSTENPLTVFGVVAALTFGLMAFSTSVRVGGTTASVAVGST